MRLLFLPAIAAIVMVGNQPSLGQSRSGLTACAVVNPRVIRANDTAHGELRTRTGQPCRFHLSSLAGWHIDFHMMEVTVSPTHGTLSTSEATGAVIYAPAPGFIGHDQFEVFYRFTAFVRPVFVVYNAEVTVTE